MNAYLFKSDRLGFRTWKPTDLEPLYALCSDSEVMRYFPQTLSKVECQRLMDTMNNEYDQRGYCYFAVDELNKNEFIGFIGLKLQTYEADFNPAVDIGWRLASNYQGRGLATEGAKRCLEFGFNELRLNSIVAVAPKINVPSINVVRKIGLIKEREFIHPSLAKGSKLQPCVLYRIDRT